MDPTDKRIRALESKVCRLLEALASIQEIAEIGRREDQLARASCGGVFTVSTFALKAYS
jgi:hypothetical protein